MRKFITVLFLSVISFMVRDAAAGDHCMKCEKSKTACCNKCEKPVQDCLNSMVVKMKSTGFIGVELDKSKTGILKVVNVIEGSPAQTVGIQVGDELIALNGLRFNEENQKAISEVKLPGKQVTCTIRRNGTNREITLTLVPMPADVMAKYIGEHMMMHAEDKTVSKK